MDETRDAHQTVVDLPDPPAVVWEALTDPPGVAAWLGQDSVMVPVEGSSLDVADEETGVRRHGRVERVEPGRHLTYTWWPADDDHPDPTATVSIELIPTGPGTRLVVTERPCLPIGTMFASTHRSSWPWRIGSIELHLHHPSLTIRC